MPEKCEGCRFFQRKEDYPGGSCRRFPPKVVGTSVLSDRYGWETNWDQAFPWVGLSDWCGEYSAVSEDGDA